MTMQISRMLATVGAGALIAAPSHGQIPAVSLPSVGATVPGVVAPPVPAPTGPSAPVRGTANLMSPRVAPTAIAPVMVTPGQDAIPTTLTGSLRGALDAAPMATDLRPGALAVTVGGLDGGDVILSSGAAAKAAPAVAIPGAYRRRAQELLRRHPDLLEADALDRPVVRGEVAGLAMAPQALARARAAGFQVRSEETLPGLGLAMVVLAPPKGMAAREALRRLRALDPTGRYDLNHIYVEGGAVTPRRGTAPPRPGASGSGLSIGLVDGSAARTAPALAGASIVQRAFAPGGARVTAHATAIASLLVGSAPGFRGAAPGARLHVADVFGPTAQGGSALAVVRALGWLAEARTPVITISLVGPPNALLAAGVAAAQARGHIVVAAVGNDGPGAPPLYPAAYPGVVAVTGVDGRRRVLPEAGRGPFVSFAAPGADMLAADAEGGFVAVRGTSFAAPLAAGRLARLLPRPDPAGARRAVATLAREAADLGAPGRDATYGRGLVAFDLAVRPGALAQRR